MVYKGALFESTEIERGRANDLTIYMVQNLHAITQFLLLFWFLFLNRHSLKLWLLRRKERRNNQARGHGATHDHFLSASYGNRVHDKNEGRKKKNARNRQCHEHWTASAVDGHVILGRIHAELVVAIVCTQIDRSVGLCLGRLDLF
jgi:hypothetical protein